MTRFRFIVYGEIDAAPAAVSLAPWDSLVSEPDDPEGDLLLNAEFQTDPELALRIATVNGVIGALQTIKGPYQILVLNGRAEELDENGQPYECTCGRCPEGPWTWR